ncbi:uncharacterized protein [Temnothorax longispinosus]|uniref:uncharacterized protein n=1 Tax=Temnothorax longispinosus TaxID=300112 RepID=UPI003A9958B0
MTPEILNMMEERKHAKEDTQKYNRIHRNIRHKIREAKNSWLANQCNIPDDWLTSTFVAIPKKPNAKKCEEYRLISLMSHALKAFLKIIHKRIYDYTGTKQLKLKLSNGSQTNSIRIAKGVRQECILSPLLFNIYVERIFRLALEEQAAGIKVNGIPINNLRYADDTAILAENIQDLQTILNAINKVGKEYGLNINISKIKLMIGPKYDLLKTILTGKIEGRRGPGRKQHLMTSQH